MDQFEKNRGKSAKKAKFELNNDFCGLEELDDLDDITPIEEK